MEIRVRPKNGARVLNPATYSPLAERGEVVPQNSYWLRRLKCGDVEEVKAVSKKHAVSKKQKSEGEQ